MPAGPLCAPPTATVYYDGGCPVCTREIATYRRLRGADACAWVDVTRCDDADLGPDLARADALARLHVRGPDGRLHRGARGFAALWRALPATAWLGRAASLAPVAALLDAAYTGFLWVRRSWRRPVVSAARGPAPQTPGATSGPVNDVATGCADAATHRLEGDGPPWAGACQERPLTAGKGFALPRPAPSPSNLT